MGQIVLNISANKIKQMKQHYHASLQKTPQAAVFRAKTPDAVITAYHSGKVLFQGSHPEKESSLWGETTASAATKKTEHSSNIDTAILEKNHIGSDESGTGDYFGPITVAAVFADKAQQAQLKKLGVEDSKHLRDDFIHQLAQKIIKLPISYTLLRLENEKYNRLQNKGWSQGKMKAMLHHHAIDKLIQKLNGTAYDGIVIDQFCTPAVYKRYLQSEALQLHDKTTFITKAESYSINVAAASILARSRFVTAMDKLSEEAGISLPKGASAAVDKAAAKYIKDHGEKQLGHVAKLHFANTEKAKKYL